MLSVDDSGRAILPKVGDSIERRASDVVDPFGGVALGALDAMRHGLHWHGCELVPRFQEAGSANIALWHRRYGPAFARWGTAELRLGDSRHLLAVLGQEPNAAAVSSPPYNLPFSQDHPGTRGGTRGTTPSEPGAFTHYGAVPGQIEGLPPGDFAAAIASPPYADGCRHTGGDTPTSAPHIQGGTLHGVGIAGVISSPPYGEARIGTESGQGQTGHGGQYSTDPGQLGDMPDAGFEAAVSSPPYAATHVTGYATGRIGDNPEAPWKQTQGDNYSRDPDNLGSLPAGDPNGGFMAEMAAQGVAVGTLNPAPETFWSAARQIVDQVYAGLRPGGHAIWVVKRYVRNHEIVEFSQQWARLCEAAGFEIVHWHRCWLVEDCGTQYNTSGDAETKTVARKSFFRRLNERRGSPAIDWEDVICMVK